MSDELEGKLFSIDTSNPFIFDLLRSKIYENPIRAICREIACNARDANRVVGKGNVPIEVTISSGQNYSFTVKDSGPGISPDSMENIFIKYASSTKRDDNNQTGGFGLGAKTPFAYTDSFTVITVFDKIKYQYLCHIDPTKFGQLVLIDSHETDEDNGTTIIVPIKNYSDANVFKDEFIDSVKYWDVLPETNFPIEKEKFYLKGDDYGVVWSTSYYDRFYILIDGIAYNATNFWAPQISGYKILLMFKNGELSITPNRESIHFDEKTKKIIQERIDKFLKDVNKDIGLEIEKEPTLQLAIAKNIELNNIFYKMIKFDYMWNNFKVPANYSYYIPSNNSVFLNIAYNNKKNFTSFTNYIKYDDIHYINDIGLTEQNYKLNIKNLIELSTKSFTIIMDKEAVEKHVPLNFLICKNLSEVLLELVEKKEKTKISIFKYDKELSKFSRTQVKSFESDANKIICFLENKKYNKLSKADLNELADITDIYGIDIELKDKFSKAFEKFKLIEDFVKDLILENKDALEKFINKAEYNTIKSRYISNNFIFYNNIDLIKSKLNNKDVYLEELSKYKSFDLIEESKLLNTVRRLYEKSEIDFSFDKLNEATLREEFIKDRNRISSLEAGFLEKYPMLKFVKSYYSYQSDYLDLITDYINEKNGASKEE